MMEERVLDIILRRLDVLEGKIDLRQSQMNDELNAIKKKIWFLAGLWSAIGGLLTVFGQKITTQLFG